MTYLTIAAAALVPSTGAACATTMTENFDNPLINWRTGFMGVHSNLENYYVEIGGTPGNRGNNPNGLWIADGLSGGQNSYITFGSAFGETITSISFLLSTFTSGVTLEFYDSDNAVLQTVNVTADALYTPSLSYGVTSSNGIGGFSLFGSGAQVEGNTSIDAITVTTQDTAPVPLPAGFPLLVAGLMGLGALSRSKKSA